MRVRFPEWEIDPARRELRIAARLVPVEPLVFDLILYLACHADRVVSKDELLEEVWGGVSVSDWAIARAIKEARKAFREHGLDARRIATVRGRGFRLREAESVGGGFASPSEGAGTAAPTAASRRELVETLARAARGLAAGRGELVLISGEPGIGKSWLAARLLDRLGAEGIVAALGRVPELGPRTRLAPWAQVLRALVQRGLIEASSLPQSTRAILREALPELVDWLGPPTSDLRDRLEERAAGEVGFRLAGAFRYVLAEVGGGAGGAIVLEDIHRADPVSLDLLAALADELDDLPILIVVTLRDSEWRARTDQHVRVLRLAEHARGRALELRGLSVAEMVELIRDESGLGATARQAAALRERTAGNPFLALQLLRTPSNNAGADAWPDLPPASLPGLARDVLARHFVSVSRECREFLTVAAVAGREFDWQLVGEAHALPPEQVVERVDEARRARLLVAADAVGARYRFTHALIAECLIAEAATGVVARAHEKLADALIARGAGGDEVISIAHHMLRGAPRGRAAEAVLYARRAARRLRDGGSFAESATLLCAALELGGSSEAEATDPRSAIETRIELGESLLQAGRLAEGRAELERAADRARRAGEVALLTHAALSFAGMEETPGTEPRRVRILELAATSLGERKDAAAVRVWGRLAQALQDPEHADRRAGLARAALARARELGDPRLACDAVRAAHFALWTPDNLAERQAWAREQLDLAESLDDVHLIHDAQMDLVADLLEDGSLARVDRVLADHEARLRSRPELLYAWHCAHYRVMRALVDGDLDWAEGELARASELGARTGYELAGQWSAVQLFTLRRQQGRLAELASVLDGVSRETPLVSWRLAAARAAAEAGDLGPARRLLPRLIVDGVLGLARDFTWLVAAVLCLELAERARAPEQREVVREALRPYADRHVTLYGMLDWGPVSAWL